MSNSTTSLPLLIVTLSVNLVLVSIVSCSSSKAIQSNARGLKNSILVDKEGNRYSIKVMPDGNTWMTINLNISIPNSYCYNDNPDSCVKYGRLYTFESAQLVCAQLGNGWVLPTRDDWHELARLYSGSPVDSNVNRRKAYRNLLIGGESGFNALLGGGRRMNGEYARGDAHGFYGTATETDSTHAWFMNFGKGSQQLFHQKDGDKPGAFSVRCVKKQKRLK